MAGRTSQELTREFEAVRQQRRDVEKPVEHVSRSFARDERALTNDEMARLADEYLKRRAYDRERCQYVVVRHRDKEHQHCHILVNRVRTDGTLVPQQYRDFIRNKETCRALEREFGLRPVRNERHPGRLGPVPKPGEERMARDRGLPSQKEQLQALIREAAEGRPAMREFVRRLRTRGVDVRANIARTGHVSGISYRLGHVAVKGSQLGRAYSFMGLRRQLGIDYDPARDNLDLLRAANATRGREAFWSRRRGLPRLPPRVLGRLPVMREMRTMMGLMRDVRQLGRSPGRALVNLASRALPPEQRATLSLWRKVIEISRGRQR